MQSPTLSPLFVSGFVNTDGCFCVCTENRKGNPYYRPTFYITQAPPTGKHISPLLQRCKDFFAGGNWSKDPRDGSTSLCINSRKMVMEKICPHFNKYPLQGEKAQDFKAFQEICQILQVQGGKSPEARATIQRLIGSMNRTSNRFRRAAGIVEQQGLKSHVEMHEPLSTPQAAQFVSGLVQGDGGFHFSFRRNPLRARPTFAVGQHALSRSLLYGLQDYFGAGRVFKCSDTHWRWSVNDLSELRQKITPHFLRDPLYDEKQHHFALFLRGLEIMEEESLSRKSRLVQLVHLLYNSNAEGKRRRLTKEQYLQLVDSSLEG